MTGNETRIVRRGETGSGEALDDISTQILRDKSNQVVAKLAVLEGPGAGNAVNLFTGTNHLPNEFFEADLRIDHDRPHLG